MMGNELPAQRLGDRLRPTAGLPRGAKGLSPECSRAAISHRRRARRAGHDGPRRFDLRLPRGERSPSARRSSAGSPSTTRRVPSRAASATRSSLLSAYRPRSGLVAVDREDPRALRRPRARRVPFRGQGQGRVGQRVGGSHPRVCGGGKDRPAGEVRIDRQGVTPAVQRRDAGVLKRPTCAGRNRLANVLFLGKHLHSK